jgi:phage-related protein
MAGKTAILSLRILGDAKEAQKALDDTATSTGKFQSAVGKAAVPAAAALAGLAAAGISAAKAAAEDQAAADQLAVALRNSAGATKATIASTETWITKTSKAAAVADDELRPALATLVRATGDVATSQDAMGVALDVSAATGKDVESVSNALAKAYAGNTASLGKMVPGMDKAVLASGDMNAILAELSRTTGGAAAAAADSAAGKWKGFQIQMGEAQEAIGGALLPAMTALGGSLQGVAEWVQENTTLFLVIGGVVGAFAAAILALNVAFKAYAIVSKTVTAVTKAWRAAQLALNAAFLTNPIFLIIVGIVALIAAIVILWQKNEGFRNAVLAIWRAIVSAVTTAWTAIADAGRATIAWLTNAWNAVLSAAQTVWNAIYAVIKPILDIIAAAVNLWVAVVSLMFRILVAVATEVWNAVLAVVGPIMDAIGAIVSTVIDLITAYIRGWLTVVLFVWNAIRAGAEAAWNAIAPVVRAVIDRVLAIVTPIAETIGAIWTGIKDAASTAWNQLYDAVKSVMDKILPPINDVKDAFNKIVDAIKSVIDWLGRIKIPDVLGKAADLINGIGRSSASAAAPASRSTGTAFAVAPTGARAFGAPLLSAAASSRTSSPTIIVQGALDPVAVARQIRQILTADQRRHGGVVLAS